MARLLTPNVNFLPTDPRGLIDRESSVARWSMEELNEVVENGGYDGIELHDARFFRHTRELHGASAEQAQQLGRLIFAFHESWQGVSDPEPSPPYEQGRESKKGNPLLRTASAVVFRDGQSSIDKLEILEGKLGHSERLPYVVFPDPKGRRDTDLAKQARLYNVRFQPTIDVVASWGARTPEEFIEEVEARKMQIVWDTLHGDRKGKMVDLRMRWEEWLPALLDAGKVTAIHACAFRDDFALTDPERAAMSTEEGKALAGERSLDGTPLGDMLQFLRERYWSGDVTIEAPVGGLARLVGHRLTRKNIVTIHRTMTQVIREALPQITWDGARL